jgi:hypothetical protein
MDNIYFIGLQEAYEVSVTLMLRELGMPNNFTVPVTKERDQSSSATSRIAKEKKELLSNQVLMARTKELNSYDIKLYSHGIFSSLSLYSLTINKMFDIVL